MFKQTFTVPETASSTLDFGVGFNWFDYLGSGGVYARYPNYPLDTQVYPALEDTASWDALLGELDHLNPGFIRFGLPPDRVLDADGALLKNSVHFARLELLAHWCERHGAVIILDPFAIPERFEFEPPAVRSTLMVNMAARDNRAYAREFVAPLLHYVVLERGLSAVKFFNPVNEPIHYGVYQVPEGGPDVYRHYVEMYAEMRSALDEVGLKEIGLLGIDKDLPFDFPVFEYLSRGIDIDPSVAAYAVHSYRGRFDYAPETALEPDTDPLRTLVDKWIKRLVSYCQSRGKPLLACEVGSFYYGKNLNPAGVASPEATLLTAETILRMINVGVRGALIWSPMNPNDIDGWWRMFSVAGGAVSREPLSYPTYALLMRHAPRGSQVYPLTPLEREYPQHVWGTAFHAPDGQVHILVINDHPHESRQITLELPLSLQRERFYRVTREEVMGDGTGASEFAPGHAECSFNDIVLPLSFQVYSSEQITTLAQGKPADVKLVGAGAVGN